MHNYIECFGLGGVSACGQRDYTYDQNIYGKGFGKEDSLWTEGPFMVLQVVK